MTFLRLLYVDNGLLNLFKMLTFKLNVIYFI